MTSDEARLCVGMLLAAYPRESATNETVVIWTKMLSDFEFEETRAAISRLVATRYTSPSIAAVRDEIVNGRLDLPGPEEAYATWLDRSHHPETAPDVHPFVRAFANSAGFDSWTMRQSEKPGATRSAFVKAYEERRREAVRRENLTALGEGGGYGAPRVQAAAVAALGGAEGAGVVDLPGHDGADHDAAAESGEVG
jgi:hypothetical protein